MADDHSTSADARRAETQPGGFGQSARSFELRADHPFTYLSRPLPNALHPAAENSPDGSNSSAAFSGEGR